LVELKGGEITVKSETGKGSVFTFVNRFILTDKPRDRALVKDEKASMERFENINILVAEDNLVNQFMLSKILKDWGVNVEMVDNGRKVLDKLQVKNYDLILMDTHMPELNGYEAAKSIRINFEEPKRSVPIISLSAAAFDYEQQEAIASGMNDLLSKPFQPDELHGKIKSLLTSRELVKS
jgi:CheY-like chemotaxis protein